MKGWKGQGRREIAIDRIRNFMSDLKKNFISERIDFSASCFVTDERRALRDSVELERKPIKAGECWGHDWQSAYFRLVADLPISFRGKELAIHLNLGGEMLIYDENGVPLYGMTNCSLFDYEYTKNYHSIGIANSNHVTLLIEVAANELFGMEMNANIISRKAKDNEGRWNAVFNYAEIGIYERDDWQLFLDLETLMNLYEGMDPLSTRAVRILGSMLDAVLSYSEHGVNYARCITAKALSNRANSSALSTTVIGHSHIDTAWLWPLAETHRKVARTFASQLDLISKYPDYIFGASSPQQYKWLKEEHPEVFEKIKKAVTDGQWELLGGMWVEPDCNLISGESFVRQILHGKKFWRKEFGKEVRTCWIPDVFGYPASMPQLLAKSGIPYFLTTKMSWSKHNKFPHDTFIWKGQDDSEVLVHFPPEHNYNAKGLAGNLGLGEYLYAEKDFLDEFATLTGIGDGGGGPKEENVERIRRAHDIEGAPKAKFGYIEDFFDRLNAHREEIEQYKGELYLEFHRGTYTTQANNKKWNREFEEGLRLVEAMLSDCDYADYPAVEIEHAIEDGLTAQFHDILPGSSINKVYRETDIMYEAIFRTFKDAISNELIRRGIKRSGVMSSFWSEPDMSAPSAMVVFNPIGYSGMHLTEIPVFPMKKGKSYYIRGKYPIVDIEGRYYSYIPLKSQGWERYDIIENDMNVYTESMSPLVLENDSVLYSFSENGRIIEAYDKIDRKPIICGKEGNILRLYHDEPHIYDAWDVDFYYPQQQCSDIECMGWKRLDAGETIHALRFTYRIGSSVMMQDVILPQNGPELLFRNTVDWKEEKKFLRVYFPVDENASWVKCDIPYGYIERKTYIQNEWDWAKFEFCAREYIDVGTPDYGFAIATDSKYGYSCRYGEMGISLLRSPLYPDPNADIHMHEFSYMYIPHKGSIDESDVRNKAALLSLKPFVTTVHETVPEFPADGTLPYWIDGNEAYVSTIKHAEDGKGIVIRIVEWRGRNANVELHTTKGNTKLIECDLLENPLRNAVTQDPNSNISLKPFEIKTFREIVID